MFVDFRHVMNLGVAVMAGRDTIGCLGGQDLVGFGLAVSPPLLLETGLQVTAAAAAAEVVGSIWCHVDEVFFTHDFLDHISHVFGHRITQGFPDQLAGILKRELNLAFLVPLRGRIEFAFSDPFGVELNDGFDFKVVRDLEFLQSCQDCEEFVPSLGVEPDLTA